MAPTEDFAKGALADALEALVRIRVHRHGVALWPMSRMWSALGSMAVFRLRRAPVPAAHAATTRGGALDAPPPMRSRDRSGGVERLFRALPRSSKPGVSNTTA